MSALFSKNKPLFRVKVEGKEKIKEEPKSAEAEETAKEELTERIGSTAFSSTGGAGAHKILKGFYVSEKATFANGMNQYFFKISSQANKSEVKKEVSKLFNVKIKAVKILNMPQKRRDLGKHPGFKVGFKKAIVVLKEGYTIGQAKP